MTNEQIVGWVLNTAGGLILLVVSAVLASMRKTVSEIRQDHNTLRSYHENLRTDHAALSARVQAESHNNYQNFVDMKNALATINEKLDRLIEKG